MVDAVMKGGEAPVNDTTTYDNGTGVIPSYLCEPYSLMQATTKNCSSIPVTIQRQIYSNL